MGNTSVPVRYDPYDAGLAYAFVKGIWVTCHSEHYQIFRGRTEREIMLASSELRNQQYRQLLNSVLCEEPPPTLNAVARRFTEFSVSFLHQHFAPECQRLVERRADYCKQGMQAAGERLQQALRETPPRSLNRLAKEIGYHSSTLLRNHPDICRSISERYESHMRNLAEDRKKTKPPFRPAS